MALFYRWYNEQLDSVPPLVILHGLLGSGSNWGFIARHLPIATLCPDMTNHGQSHHTPIMDYHSMANDLIELLDHLHIPRCMLLGHSMGAKIAMNLALRYPNRVERLAAVDMAPKPYYHSHRETFEAMRAVSRAAVSKRREARALLKRAIPEQSIVAYILTNLVDSPGSDDNTMIWRCNLEGIAASDRNIVDWPHIDAIYDKPVLAIGGGLSDRLSSNDLDIIYKYFPNSTLEIFENAGHWVHSDEPQRTIATLTKFFVDRN